MKAVVGPPIYLTAGIVMVATAHWYAAAAFAVLFVGTMVYARGD